MSKRQILILLGAVALIIVIAGATVWVAVRAIEKKVEQAVTAKEEMVDLGTLITRVRDLNRLETATMRISTTSTVSQSYDLIPNALAGDELTLNATGDVIAGVDLSLLTQDDIRREADGTVVVRMPPPQLLLSRIDNRTTHVAVRRTGVFRRADVGMEGRARQYAEQSIRNEAVHKGILQLAQKNAEARIAALLHTLGATKVRFVGPQGGAGAL